MTAGAGPMRAPGTSLHPELDAGRACFDDHDLDCAWREAEAFVMRHPDDPSGHALLGSVVTAADGDFDAVRAELEPFGEDSALDLDRRELLSLTWRALALSDELHRAAPSVEMSGERNALLVDLALFTPEDEEEELHRDVTMLGVLHAEHPDETETPLGEWTRFMEEGDDPTALYQLSRSLHGDAWRLRGDAILDRLLRSDPASPRYPAYLLLAAGSEPDPARALRELIASGLPDPRYEDDAWLALATREVVQVGWIRPETQYRLETLVHAGPKSTTRAAARLLAEKMPRWEALRMLDEVETSDPGSIVSLGNVHARILADTADYQGAAEELMTSLRVGGTDEERWFEAARDLQRAGRDDEALKLYQYYLLRVDEQAAGLLPFEPRATPSRQLRAHLRVWGQYLALQPGFFASLALRQLLEFLALASAGMLAMARVKRARAFLLPAALGAELTFFAGWIALRCGIGADAPFLVRWAWLAISVVRTFVLVGGGLYLSATAALPRRSRGRALWLTAASLAALGAGWRLGIPSSPGAGIAAYLSPMTRLGELGLAPRSVPEWPVLVVAALRGEAASRLVWPALVLSMAVTRRSVWHAIAAGIAVAAITASGSFSAFGPAFAASLALILARVRLGSAAPFLLHIAFLTGGALALPGFLR